MSIIAAFICHFLDFRLIGVFLLDNIYRLRATTLQKMILKKSQPFTGYGPENVYS